MVIARNLPAYILAGGKSKRFGSDKARILIDGVPLVQRIARQPSLVVSSVTVIGKQLGCYSDLGLRCIADRRAGCGPLGGLDAAIADCRSGWLLLVSCDFVHFENHWVEMLHAQAATPHAAVALRDEHWESLFALYHTSLANKVTHQLSTGEFAMWKLLEAANTCTLRRPADWSTLAHINTPHELAQTLSEAELRKDL